MTTVIPTTTPGQKWIYILPSNAALYCLDQFRASVRLRACSSDQLEFQLKIRKMSVRRSRFRKYAELSYLPCSRCTENGKEMYKDL